MDRISITTDMWKSGQKIQYIVLMAHFVDLDWNLQKKEKEKVLNFVDVPPPHSGVFGIEGKACSISVDNASYNDATVRMLKYSLSFHKRLPLNEKLFHVHCCAHILNLLVHDGLSEIENIIDNVRESVKHITTSTMRLTMFTDIVKQLQLPNKRLILDCCTRWNATYAMLSYLLEFKDLPTLSQENFDDFDALEWWKVNSLKFRILSKMTCEILSIPITTVASKSVLSAGGRVIDAYRSSLGTDTVQMLLCGSDWYYNF
ncbi:zinc finger BED domain-containing protein RICESLEEPER 2-like [Gossypium australe]|uniref:Zinc finger BED domain-containing protein RICESLEEPER 2-like n=1 Tax=Gossypium australe TaxID=47621 RepID=A0A5B6W887_9ROSI|nr:zinc finger BED domain-containing protein RICESLEEPER 2-like [Gossypium australe]